jgi:hypothetical protein
MFPFDIFDQAFQGNWVAWFGIILTIITFGILVFLIILWVKLPKYAKIAFVNNLVGHRPTVAECYENRLVKFLIPKMFRNGLMIAKHQWFVPYQLWASAGEDLTDAERQTVNAVYSIEGGPGFYLNYSIQAGVVNPELVVLMQHERALQRLGSKEPVLIKKERFIEALNFIEDKEIQLSPMSLNLPLDIPNIRTMMPKSLSKSQWIEQENKIRQDVLEGQKGLNLQTVILVVAAVGVIVGIVALLHDFHLF